MGSFLRSASVALALALPLVLAVDATGEPGRAKTVPLASIEEAKPTIEAKAPTEAKPTSRTFTMDVRPGDAKSIRTIEIVTTTDPKSPDVAKKVELRIGKPGKAPDQVISFAVDEGVEMVLGSADDVDLNFDGYRDFWVVSDFGAKYARYEAFVFDPKAQRFVKDSLAREVSALMNPEVDMASKRIVTTSIGPADPSRTVRKVQGGHLIVTDSCVFHNDKDYGSDGKGEGLLVVKKLVQGVLKVVTQKPLSVAPGDDPCAP